MSNNIEFKTIKVSQKGQIVIPVDMQREIGIKKGDEILLIRKGNKIVLEKRDEIVKKLKNEFRDIQTVSERSLKKFWLNRKDEIWNQYVKSGKK